MSKVSIITICFNAEKYLEGAIQSVAAQTYPNIEYIIVDGGSSDGTLDIIKEHEQAIDRWVSEPDEGISDAMNKGVSLATGNFVYFLNSDDYLEDEDVIAEAARHLNADDDVYFFALFLEKDGKKALCKPGRFRKKINIKLGLSHQSAICSIRLFKEIGVFDTSLRVTMDYDLFLRAYRKGLTARSIDLPIATMRLIGISSQTDWPSLKRRFEEEQRIHMKNCPSFWMRLVYEVYWLLYWPYRRARFFLVNR
jgi:glycosyltransferase involved in cell wall biosynthesis